MIYADHISLVIQLFTTKVKKNTTLKVGKLLKC